MTDKRTKKSQNLAAREPLDFARAKYRSEWDATSTAHANAGDYDWMASFLPRPGIVLEVGVGTGLSTHAIYNNGNIVIGIDENPQCLELAEKHLLSNNVPCERISRQSYTAVKDALYQLGHRKIDATIPPRGVLLIEGDFISDPDFRDRCIDLNLQRWLEGASPFDAIACWLIGTHEHRNQNLAVLKRRVESSGEYRLLVQNFVYEMADRLLRPGGILQFVDRGEDASQPAFRADALQGHREQASVTSLKVRDQLEQRRYSHSEGIQLILTRPLSGRQPEMTQLFLTSIIAEKPSLSG